MEAHQESSRYLRNVDRNMIHAAVTKQPEEQSNDSDGNNVVSHTQDFTNENIETQRSCYTNICDKTNDNNIFKEKPQKLKYTKRSGTSGAAGQLYETNILSLILFRLLQDKHIEVFQLGSNLAEVGDFDDICFRFIYKNEPVAVFIQCKHKEDSKKAIRDDGLFKTTNKLNVQKLLKSYLQIKNNFHSENKNSIFDGKFDDVDFHFIVYTSATNTVTETRKERVDNEFHNKVKDIITIGRVQGDIFQIKCDEEELKILLNVVMEERIQFIAKSFVDYIDSCNNDAAHDFIQKYQSLLVPEVILTEENDNSYIGTINPKFYNTNDKVLNIFRELIYKEMVNRAIVEKIQFSEQDLRKNLQNESEDSAAKYLSTLIGHTIIYDDKSNKLAFKPKTPAHLTKNIQLNNIEISQSIVNKAMEIAGKQKLESVKLEIPEDFINKHTIEQSNDVDKIYFFEDDVKDFLSKFYFYTRQGMESDVAKELINEISKHYNDFEHHMYKNRIQAETAFLKFHDKVQKWWLNKAYYLTNDCDWLQKLSEGIVQPFIVMLDYIVRHDINQYDITFKTESIQCLKLDDGLRITNIVTESLTLTSIKLNQHFHDRCFFISLTHLYKLYEQDWDWLKDELKVQTKEYLVLICENLELYLMAVRRIVNVFNKKIIIVSNVNINNIDDHNILVNCVIADVNNNLAEMNSETQNKLLDYKIDFQGVPVSLKSLINLDFVKIIKAEIIQKILNNEKIVIGSILTNPNYERIKYFYIQRTLTSTNEAPSNKNEDYSNENSHTKEVCETVNNIKLNTFKDVGTSVNVITAKPGMGKSTTLTHLSIKTKQKYPEIWIARINLLDYCKVFKTWKETERNIDITDTLKLILKSQVNEVKFSVEHVNGKIKVEYKGNDSTALFNIDIFEYCFNMGNMIILFDGFDEICPEYQDEVINFIKNITSQARGHDNIESLGLQDLNYHSEKAKSIQIWITSRPYNAIKERLESEFGKSYFLMPLTYEEQCGFYKKYWNCNIQAEELDEQLFKNIKSFFEFMKLHLSKILKPDFELFNLGSTPQLSMYVYAVTFFTNIFHSCANVLTHVSQLPQWTSIKIMTETIASRYRLQLAGAPLYMYVEAAYLTSELKSKTPKLLEDWKVDFNVFSFTDRFVKFKLKLRCEQKDGMDTSKPNVNAIFKKEKKEFLEIHKAMAFYFFFHHSKYLKLFLPEDKILEITQLIKKIERGEETTGLIESVHNDEPKFIHLSCAEYFAVEFIADLINNSKPSELPLVIDFVVFHFLKKEGLMNMFDQKIMADQNFRSKLQSENIKKRMFDNFISQINDDPKMPHLSFFN